MWGHPCKTGKRQPFHRKAATPEGRWQAAEEYGGGSDYSPGRAAAHPATDLAQLISLECF